MEMIVTVICVVYAIATALVILKVHRDDKKADERFEQRLKEIRNKYNHF